MDVVIENPDKDWNWHELSRIIPINDILKHSEFPWDWYYVSQNKSVTIEHIIRNLNNNWNWHELSKIIHIDDILKYTELPWKLSYISSCNKSVTFDHIIAIIDTTLYLDEYLNLDDNSNWYNKLNLCNFSLNLPIDDILKYPELPWDWFYVSINKSFTFNLVIANPKKYWNWTSLSKTIHINDILKYSEFPWDWDYVSQNKSVTIEHIIANLNIEWEWYYLSEEMHIDDILAHPEFDWKWDCVSANNSVTINHIIANPYIKWEWHYLSDIIHIDDILAHPELPWKWRWVSGNKSVTINHIIANPEKKWKWSVLSEKIDIDNILKYSELPWDYNSIPPSISLTHYISRYYNINVNNNCISIEIYNKLLLTNNDLKTDMKIINHFVHPFIDELIKSVHKRHYNKVYHPDNYERVVNEISHKYVEAGKYISINDIDIMDIYDEVNEELENQLAKYI